MSPLVSPLVSPLETLLDRVVRGGAAALRGAGARELDVLLDHRAGAVRFEFTGPSGGRGYVAAFEEYESYGVERSGPVVFASSLLGERSGDLAGLAEDLRSGSAVPRPGAWTSNDALRALDAARDSLAPGVLVRLYETSLEARWNALDSSVRVLTRSTLFDAAPDTVEAATRVLTDVAAGASVEWALRRALPVVGDGR